MSQPNDLPPVGAMVMDASGCEWRVSDDRLWHRIICDGVQVTQGVPPGDHQASLTATWRLQQECAHQAHRAEEAEAAWTEEKQLNVALNARVAALRQVVVDQADRVAELEMVLRWVYGERAL